MYVLYFGKSLFQGREYAGSLKREILMLPYKFSFSKN